MFYMFAYTLIYALFHTHTVFVYTYFSITSTKQPSATCSEHELPF